MELSYSETACATSDDVDQRSTPISTCRMNPPRDGVDVSARTIKGDMELEALIHAFTASVDRAAA